MARPWASWARDASAAGWRACAAPRWTCTSSRTIPICRRMMPALRGVELVADLSALLQEADYISLHAPLTPDTRGLIGPREFSMMKPTAILINCARGGILDEDALVTALLEGQITGAAIDVWQQEPPPSDHPLFSLENVIVSPHMAAHTEEAMIRMATTLATDITLVLQGNRPHFCVNPAVFSM